MARTTGGIDPSRRRFLESAGRGVAGAVAVGSLVALHAREAQARLPEAIRPPGALADERAFLSACVRCGLCVRDCPYKTLTLAALGDRKAAAGTPYFIARDIPCEMCDDIPCVLACPTGALAHSLKDITKAKMGTAVLVDTENCLNWLGLRCDVCYRVCPVIDKAITLEIERNERTGKHARFVPTVHADACTGCGKCEKSCVLPEAAIKVLPLHLARASSAEHYRKGWVEKEKNHGPIVPGIEGLPQRLPEAPR